MPLRSTASLLTTIAEDVSDMASVAHALDELSSELDLTHVDQNKVRDLQRVDALFQHLDDISALLHRMATAIGSGPDLDTQDLCLAVRLDYLKTRLTHSSSAKPCHAGSGDVDLF